MGKAKRTKRSEVRKSMPVAKYLNNGGAVIELSDRVYKGLPPMYQRDYMTGEVKRVSNGIPFVRVAI